MKAGKTTHSKHHFVPEFYLRAWATPDESQAERLTYFRWIQGRLHVDRISPKGAAYEVDLYAAVDKDGRKTQTVEKEFFGPRVDDPAAPGIAKMIAGGQPLTGPEAEAFARYLLAQRVRHPGYVKHLRAEAALAADELVSGLEADYQALRSDEMPSSASEFIQQHFPHLNDHLGVQSPGRLIDQPALLATLLEFDWASAQLDAGDRTLLTSDRPAVFTKGLSDPTCIIALPLSPEVAVFGMKDSSRLKRLLGQPPRVLVSGLNLHVVSQAQAFVYSRDDLQRTFVEKYLRKPQDLQPETFRRLRP